MSEPWPEPTLRAPFPSDHDEPDPYVDTDADPGRPVWWPGDYDGPVYVGDPKDAGDPPGDEPELVDEEWGDDDGK